MFVVSEACQASAFDHELIDAVAELVDAKLTAGIHAATLPEEAVWVAQFARYDADVLNGGHSQFVGNARSNAANMLAGVVAFTKRLGLDQASHIAATALDWVTAHPGEAMAQTGFNGGIAPDLAALDQPYYQLGALAPQVAAWLRTQPWLTFVPPERVAQEQAAAEKAWIASNPAAQHAQIRFVAKRLENWFSDPVQVGLALAAGENNAGRLAHTIVQPTSPRGVFAMSDVSLGTQRTDICHYELSEAVLTVTSKAALEGEEAFLKQPIEITTEQIARVQRLALEFRMPQSLGLRWWRTAWDLDLRKTSLYELPNWAPGKFWLRLMGDGWGLKGSPEKSTFAGPVVGQESLLQEEIAARVQAVLRRGSILCRCRVPRVRVLSRAPGRVRRA